MVIEDKGDKKKEDKGDKKKEEDKGDKKKDDKGDKKKELREKEKNDDKQAKLIVELPADARLFIDGAQMKSGSTRRGVITPPLQSGQIYHYEVKVELVRNGHTLSETQRVRLIPGELVHARFPNLESRAAAIVKDSR